MRIVWLALLLALGGWDLFRSPNPHVEEGNEHFKDGRYDQAIESYRKAEKQLPSQPGIHFDLGVALYQKAMNTGPGPERAHHLAEAAREFTQAGDAWDPQLKSAASYNLGNTRFQEGKYAEAAEEYKKAIRRDPRNQDARYNLELAMRRKELKEQKEQPQKEPQPGTSEDKQGPPQDSQAPAEGNKGKENEPSSPSGQDPPAENPNEAQEKGTSSKEDQGKSPEGQAPPQPHAKDEDKTDQEPGNDPRREAAAKENAEGRAAKEPGTNEPYNESDRKLDALERRSKNLLIDKQRARANERRRGRYLKDW